MTMTTLWTIQHRAVLAPLRAGAPYLADPAHSEHLGDGGQRAYDWLMSCMPPRPEGARTPVWAWTARPRLDVIDLPAGHPYVLLELAVAERDITRTRLHAWERGPLSGSLSVEEDDAGSDAQDAWWAELAARGITTDDVWDHPELAARVHASWRAVLDVTRDPADPVQATVWAVRPEHLVRAHRLPAAGLYCDVPVRTETGTWLAFRGPRRLRPGRVLQARELDDTWRPISPWRAITIEHAGYGERGLQVRVR